MATLTSPKVTSPQVASPKVASPKVASPKVASPKVASPKVASPKVASLLAIPQPEQRTAAWYEARHGRLTASDAATALGLNPYETADELVLKKCGRGVKFMGNEATAHGERWEDYVRQKFENETGLKAYEAGLLPHPTVEFLGGSPDGLLSSNDGTYAALLEIKCPLRRKITGKVPGYYMPQLQLLMSICDLDEAYFVEFKPEGDFSPEEFSVTKVPRQEDWLDVNMHMFRYFWSKVEYMRQNPEAADELEESVAQKKKPKMTRVKKRARIVDLDDGGDDNCMICI